MFNLPAGKLSDGPNFHASDARRWDLRSDLDGFVEVSGVNQIETGQLLFGFCERTIHHGNSAVADAYSRGSVNGLERLRSNALPAIP
jgi:hypothetical protein